MATAKMEDQTSPSEVDVEDLERSPWNPYDVDEGQGRGDATYSYDSLFDWAYAVFPEPVTIMEASKAFEDASRTTMHRMMHKMADEDGVFGTEQLGGGARIFWINPDLIDYEAEDYPEPVDDEPPDGYLREAEATGKSVDELFEHEDHGDFAEHYSDDDFLAALRARWPAGANKSQIADYVGCSMSLLKYRLPPLVGANIVNSKQIAGRTTVYWLDRPDITYSGYDSGE